MGDKPDGSEKVLAASAEEIKIFEQSRRHLPATVFDAKRWQAVVGPEWWPHVVTVLNRGGRFQDYKKAYKDGQMANKIRQNARDLLRQTRLHKKFHDRQALPGACRLFRRPPGLHRQTD